MTGQGTAGRFSAQDRGAPDGGKDSLLDARRRAERALAGRFPLGVAEGLAAGLARDVIALTDALERIALGIGGRQESGLLPHEGEDYLATMPKPDWKLAREALGTE